MTTDWFVCHDLATDTYPLSYLGLIRDLISSLYKVTTYTASANTAVRMQADICCWVVHLPLPLCYMHFFRNRRVPDTPTLRICGIEILPRY